jgi:hypothetical protein
MNTKFARLILLAAALCFGSLSSLMAADAPKPYVEMSNKIFKALEAGDFDQFMGDADESFKKSTKKGTFDGIAGQIGPRLKGGYDLVYLGDLKRSGGVQLTLWKIVFKAGGDDMAFNMNVKDGKVASIGFPRL